MNWFFIALALMLTVIPHAFSEPWDAVVPAEPDLDLAQDTDRLAEAIAELTQGEISLDFQTYLPTQIGDVLSLLRARQVDIAVLAPADLAKLDPNLAEIGSAYLHASYSEVNELNKTILPFVEERLQEHGLTILFTLPPEPMGWGPAVRGRGDGDDAPLSSIY